MWDIAIVAGIGFTQLVLTWYGIHISVKEHRVRNAIIVGFIGAMGIGLTLYGALRSSKAQIALQSQLDKIQHNTEKPPTVTVNVPPSTFSIPSVPRHTHVEYFPVLDASRLLGLPQLALNAGDTPTIPIAFRNSGGFAVKQPTDSVLLTLVPSKRAQSAFRDLRTTFVKSNGPSGSIPTSSSDGEFHTAVGPKLSDADIARLKSGEVYLCGLGAVRWLDETGWYETHFAQCLQAEPDHQSLNWHMLRENNEEQKIK